MSHIHCRDLKWCGMSERCKVCFRHCELNEGEMGFCGARICEGGVVKAQNYGRLTALALDPIEKKPLARFHPGSMILSAGSYGCNLRCPFCQNSDISWSDEALAMAEFDIEYISPERLCELAHRYKDKGNIGIAFTYNEPLVGYEFVRDTAKLAHESGMLNVLVSNGTASAEVFDEIAPYIDAMNIDLKGFSDNYYNKILGGSRKMVMEFIEMAADTCHLELTTLIVPGQNDSDEEMREMTSWIAGLKSKEPIALHITRFFPRFHMTDKGATDVKLIYHLADVAREKLEYVYTGNC